MSEKKNRNSTLCCPDTTQSLGHTNIVCLELVQTNSGGEGECAQEPVAGSAELGHTGRREVVDDGGLESDVRVGDDQRAQDGVHDGVEGTSGERSEGERDQADADQSLKRPVVAALGGVGFGNGSRVVHGSLDSLGQRGQDLLLSGGMESDDLRNADILLEEGRPGGKSLSQQS